jgi:hypothetical protein
MRSRFGFLAKAGLLALALPVLSFSAAVQVTANGAVSCPVGNCATPDTISASGGNTGGNSSAVFNFNITLADGDKYNVDGYFNNMYHSNTGGQFGFFPSVSYIGSTPTVRQDTISLDMLQTVFDSSCCSFNSPPAYTETIPFVVPSTPAGVTETGQVFYGIPGSALQGVGLLSSTGPGSYTLTASKNLFGLVSNTLNVDYNLTYVFPDGTPTGTTGGSPAPPNSVFIPEPTESMLMGIGLSGMFLLAARKAGQNKKS